MAVTAAAEQRAVRRIVAHVFGVALAAYVLIQAEHAVGLRHDPVQVV